MKKLSKRMAALSTKIEDRIYAPLEALSIIKENACLLYTSDAADE